MQASWSLPQQPSHKNLDASRVDRSNLRVLGRSLAYLGWLVTIFRHQALAEAKTMWKKGRVCILEELLEELLEEQGGKKSSQQGARLP